MPVSANFEGKTYTFPDGTSQQDVLDFLDSLHPAPSPLSKFGNAVYESTLKPFAHPLDTLQALGHSLINPDPARNPLLNPGVSLVLGYADPIMRDIQNKAPAEALGHAIGPPLMGAATYGIGEGLSAIPYGDIGTGVAGAIKGGTSALKEPASFIPGFFGEQIGQSLGHPAAGSAIGMAPNVIYRAYQWAKEALNPPATPRPTAPAPPIKQSPAMAAWSAEPVKPTAPPPPVKWNIPSQPPTPKAAPIPPLRWTPVQEPPPTPKSTPPPPLRWTPVQDNTPAPPAPQPVTVTPKSEPDIKPIADPAQIKAYNRLNATVRKLQGDQDLANSMLQSIAKKQYGSTDLKSLSKADLDELTATLQAQIKKSSK